MTDIHDAVTKWKEAVAKKGEGSIDARHASASLNRAMRDWADQQPRPTVNDDGETVAWDGVQRETDLCSRCGCDGWSIDGYLIYFRLVTQEGEEGYADVTQALCQECYDIVVPQLIELGFKGHNHHGTYPLDDPACTDGCKTPAEYGPELVQT